MVNVRFRIGWVLGIVVAGSAVMVGQAAPPLVPGTGQKVVQVGDDFEEAQWSFQHNLPKSSDEQDERKRLPTGNAANGRWYEGIKRGQPDVLQRVPTPPGGLEGSTHALLMRTRQSGIPGRLSYQMQQDDFVANVYQRLGGKIPVSQQPSVVVRVFMPPLEEWENRPGATFGFRIALDAHVWKVPEGKRRQEYVRDPYWPGMFVEYQGGRGQAQESASWRLRGDSRGRDFRGPAITQTGWWTLGMSVTADGQVHYFISPGVDDLTAEDHVASHFPYGRRAERFRTFFFNVCNRDDGRTWSTNWIIDDPSLYYVPTRQANAGRSTR